ncbi:hypothetical protein METBIDRAFT_202652 [Metschnikowia bicuspidata var. bicuspidata NRRL YB-4993]|uniref:Uncharacterized protein n=1 Tax=Metschnikowia bicuspidata var. bicuspidata NRRL YB-4993 TaxID=869754 RepID=A0A1A0H962_9ASCO|nr:hypothetical protein METBIDRAFT_202652 [Metschnikowia bicuspidata var. bicuspidata NRRL YB-4993]OBA20664.1 hypothetical protein METBIDRAFT_202652 [Metschnikowia bicuspidata var. bicuspidata NRRL YB-4993]
MTRRDGRLGSLLPAMARFFIWPDSLYGPVLYMARFFIWSGSLYGSVLYMDRFFIARHGSVTLRGFLFFGGFPWWVEESPTQAEPGKSCITLLYTISMVLAVAPRQRRHASHVS